MQKDCTPDEVKQALAFLLHTAKKHGALVVGFMVHADEPVWMTRVSNVKDEQFNGTIAELVRLTNTKKAQGLVADERVLDVA
jgi:hypothetical protein